jgi:hypothetical protein
MRWLRLPVLAAAGSLLLPLSVVPRATADDEVVVPPERKKVKIDLPKQEIVLPAVDRTGASGPATPGKPVPPAAQPSTKPPKPAAVFRATEIAPERALAVLHFPDVTRMARAAGNSPYGRLMSDEILGRFWTNKVLGSMKELPPATKGLPSGAGLVGIVTRMQELSRAEVLLAAYAPARENGSPRLLGVFEMDDNRQSLFRDSLPQLRLWAGLTEDTGSKTVSAGDFGYDCLIQRKITVLCHGFVGNQLVIATDEELYREVLRLVQVKGERSLARDPEWSAACARAGRNADAYVKVELPTLMGKLGSGLDERSRKALTAQMRGMRHLSGALTFQAGTVRDRMYLHMDADSELLRSTARKSPNPALARLAPLDACVFDLKRFEPGTLAQAAGQNRGAAPGGQAQSFDDEVARVLEKSCADSNALKAVSGSMAHSVVLSGMGTGMDFDALVVLEADDQEQFKQVMVALDKAAKDFVTDTYMGAQVKFWSPPEDDAGVAGPLSPMAGMAGMAASMPGLRKLLEASKCPLGLVQAYAVAGSYVVFGTSQRIVKLAVRQTDPVGRSSCIEDKPDFKEAREILGRAPGEIRMTYVDLRRFGEMLFAMGSLGAGAEDMPPMDKVVAQLGGMLVSVRREDSGVTVEVCSPVGMMPLVGAGTVGGYVWALDARASREAARHTDSLKTIWRGLEIFATDFNRYPLKPSELFGAYVEDTGCFVTPEQQSDDVPVKIATAEDVNTKSGYAYLPGRSPNAAANILIMYSLRPDSRGRHWCLFTNGRVAPVSAEGLKGLLERSRN